MHTYLANNNYSNLGLSPSEFHLNWKGVGGLKIPQLFQFFDYIRDLQPSVIVLEIGSNDLCDHAASAHETGSSLASFVGKVLGDFPFVKHIIIGQVITRNLASWSQRNEICATCGALDHVHTRDNPCILPPRYVICDQGHASFDRSCPKWKLRRK
jgi:hypothetical protein